MHEQYSNSSRVAATETMRWDQDAKRTRFPKQSQATYKIGCAANIPSGNVLIKSICIMKHSFLWKQEEFCHIIVDDRSERIFNKRRTVLDSAWLLCSEQTREWAECAINWLTKLVTFETSHLVIFGLQDVSSSSHVVINNSYISVILETSQFSIGLRNKWHCWCAERVTIKEFLLVLEEYWKKNKWNHTTKNLPTVDDDDDDARL